MKRMFCIALVALIATTSLSADEAVVDQSIIERWETDPTQVFDASEVSLAELQWLARAVVIFADTPNDPRFRQQMDLLLADIDRLIERDVILITDTDPAARTSVRIALRPRGYALTVVDKDGRVLQRKPELWSVRELTRSIDRTPLRQQEIEDRRGENLR
ncbi:DUF4174 domain-containing protein [Yoonia vestfoldensis]|uniref:DUF4174 domain-containing protein n=1 Tax=Yoonia vestfoldensis TaxID=245188 RepID=A0A1Y0ECV8_9RHOB|nr:DUF4174 domain-containing protein [Yoonia vestfoldensis]ARU01435.1 hypothetical protein LOKVESSMR4R_02127 [Yoonia vestfoldensis]